MDDNYDDNSGFSLSLGCICLIMIVLEYPWGLAPGRTSAYKRVGAKIDRGGVFPINII